MPVLSYVHQLCHADPCPSSMQTLRWQDRPLPCPRCQSHAVDPWGMDPYRPGGTRYWGNGCQRPCTDLPNTRWPQRKRSLPYWLLATFLLGLSCASPRLAREGGVHPGTS